MLCGVEWYVVGQCRVCYVEDMVRCGVIYYIIEQRPVEFNWLGCLVIGIAAEAMFSITSINISRVETQNIIG